MVEEPTIDEVGPGNVLRLLEGIGRKKGGSDYCYEKRKEEIRYQDKLKSELLKRYNLVNFDLPPKKPSKVIDSSSFPQITVVSGCSYPEKRSKKISKGTSRRPQLTERIDELSLRIVRKIYSMLRNNR